MVEVQHKDALLLSESISFKVAFSARARVAIIGYHDIRPRKLLSSERITVFAASRTRSKKSAVRRNGKRPGFPFKISQLLLCHARLIPFLEVTTMFTYANLIRLLTFHSGTDRNLCFSGAIPYFLATCSHFPPRHMVA